MVGALPTFVSTILVEMDASENGPGPARFSAATRIHIHPQFLSQLLCM